MRLQTNSFRLKISNRQIFEVQKYALSFSPEIPVNSKVQGKVFGKVKKELTEKFFGGEFLILFGGSIYSLHVAKDRICVKAEYDG